MFKKLYLVGLVCCLLAPSSAFAEKGKLSFTPYMGAIAATSRDMVDSASLSVSAAQTWSDGSQLSAKFRADVKSQSFQDTHDTPLLTGFDIGYFIKDDLEVFGGFQYVQAGGNTTKRRSGASSRNSRFRPPCRVDQRRHPGQSQRRRYGPEQPQ